MNARGGTTWLADTAVGVEAASSPHGSAGAPVVTLCGSMRFAELMLRVAGQLTARGVIVLAPFVVAGEAGRDGGLVARLDELHRRKIAMSSRVVVVTDGSGYWGASTEAEIAYAQARRIPVTIRRVRAGGARRARGAR